MPANKMSRAAREELGRRMAAQTRARIAAGDLPPDHYARCGRRGFEVTLAKYGAQRVAQLLSAFYGRPIDAGAIRYNAERAREHAATRRAYPLAGQVCARCGAPAEHRDHAGPRGWRDGHGPGMIQFVCAACHRATEVARIKEAS